MSEEEFRMGEARQDCMLSGLLLGCSRKRIPREQEWNRSMPRKKLNVAGEQMYDLRF